MSINCMNLYIGAVGIDNAGREWVYHGMRQREATDAEKRSWSSDAPPVKYVDYVWSSPTGYDDPDEEMVTHYNGVRAGGADWHKIVRVK